MKAFLGKFPKRGKRKIEVKIHGYDCWNLNHTISVVAYPLLKRFRELQCGHPATLTQEEWDEILDQMIWSMKVVVEEKDCAPAGSLIEIKRFYRKLNRGFELFGKHFQSLWY